MRWVLCRRSRYFVGRVWFVTWCATQNDDTYTMFGILFRLKASKMRISCLSPYLNAQIVAVATFHSRFSLIIDTFIELTQWIALKAMVNGHYSEFHLANVVLIFCEKSVLIMSEVLVSLRSGDDVAYKKRSTNAFGLRMHLPNGPPTWCLVYPLANVHIIFHSFRFVWLSRWNK